MLLLLAVNGLLVVIALGIQQRTIWLLHRRVAHLETHRLESIREYMSTVENERIAALNQRIFDEITDAQIVQDSLELEDDEDAEPVTRH